MSDKQDAVTIELGFDQVAEYTGVLPQEIPVILQCIYDLVAKFNEVTYVEIGVLYGGMLRRVLDNFHKTVNIIGIDLFEDFKLDPQNTHGGNVTTKSRLEEALRARGYIEFTLIKGDSDVVVKSLPQMEHVCCFIDGNHSYEGCLKDFENIYKKMSRGYILFHDSQFEEVNKVVKRACELPDIKNLGQVWSVRILSKNL